MAVQSYPRFAIYYAPETDERLAALGAAWLGYDAAKGKTCAQPVLPGIDGSCLQRITEEPRRYGFHGTLKPPFVLAAGCNENDLLDEVRSFARSRRVAPIGAMKLAVISSFIALVPADMAPDLLSLAAACVRHFDGFRAPASEAELARRRAAALTARQDALLRQWGYPYVMEEFRFHLTLTGKVSREEQGALLPVLQEMFKPDRIGPITVQSLVVFRQDATAQPFRIVARAALAG